MSGEFVTIDGSIYEGIEAALTRNDRTIAHVVKYSDAVALAAALNSVRPEPVEGLSSPWLPLDPVALNGEMYWLLVDYSAEDADHALADAAVAATIGFWQEIDADEGQWNLAGWCWTHDHFTEGRGKVVAYKAIGFSLEDTLGYAPAEPVAQA